MDEKRPNNIDEQKVNIKLERHLWPDEIKEKKRKNRLIVLIVLGLIASFSFGVLFNKAYLASEPVLTPPTTQNQDQTDDANNELSKFQSIYNILGTKWYFNKDFENPSKELVENAIEGMIELNGDIHTKYFSAEEFNDFQAGLDSNFVGIGVQYYNIDGYNIVDRVFPNSPAQKAGVMAGDIFYAVNGQNVIGTDSDVLADTVRGEEDTIVDIDFKRGEAIVSLRISRGQVLTSAFGEMVAEGVGYLEINSFSLQTGEEVKYYLDSMTQAKANKLIIDVRDNGGGYLATLNTIASFFLSKDQIVIQEEFAIDDIDVTYSKGNVYENFEQIVVLINENSASASEVLTAALKENLNIEVIGVTSYGKGTVQVTRTFEDGSALKYTTAQWLTPNGNQIHDVGIEPTIEVKLHEIFYQPYPIFEENKTQLSVNSVGEAVSYTQYALDFLGYEIERFDGYYDELTHQSLLQYQQDLKMRTNGIINKSFISSITSSIIREWNLNKEIHDLQYQRALELFSN